MAGIIHVAVIGCGQMGMHHAKIYASLPGVELVAICERFDERREAAAKELNCKGFADMEEMFIACPEIDAVSITMPDNAHLSAVETAVKYHKHILLEKPIAKDLADGKTILKKVENYDRVFLVGHLLRYDPRFFGLKESIDNGDMGEIVHIYLRRNSPIVGPRRYIGASDLSMHVMIHDIDYVNWFLGCKPVKVFAKARSVALAEYHMNDVIYALVTYENGTVVCMEACWTLPETSPTIIDDQVELVGTKGTAYIDSCDKGLRLITSDRVLYPDTRHWPYVAGVPSGDLCAELSSFVSAIAGNSKPLSTAQDAYRALTVVEAIERSLKEGAEVELADW